MLFGPNNQLIMVLHLASLAGRLCVRFLAPPLPPHYFKTIRQDVLQNSSQILAEEISDMN
jgi:hypothetical protein